jgi:hypothetical protein
MTPVAIFLTFCTNDVHSKLRLGKSRLKQGQRCTCVDQKDAYTHLLHLSRKILKIEIKHALFSILNQFLVEPADPCT